jgi:hypothetical protein
MAGENLMVAKGGEVAGIGEMKKWNWNKHSFW